MSARLTFSRGSRPRDSDVDLSNGQARQKSESPLAVFHAVGRGAADSLGLAEGTVFVEEQSAFAS